MSLNVTGEKRLSGKESACNARNVGDVGSIPRSGRSPAGGNGIPLQYSCLGNPMDRGAWWSTVHRGAKKSDITEQLGIHARGKAT